MPSNKVSGATLATSLDGTEYVPVVQSGQSKRAPVSLLIANAIMEAVARAQRLDQLAPPAGNLHMNNQRLTNLADGLDATDVASMQMSGAGWIRDSLAWTRTSNTTFTQAGDSTAYIKKGTRLRWTESSAIKFGVVATAVHSAGTTTVTMMPTSDYVMAASPDGGSPRYAIGKPADFPTAFAWVPVHTAGFSAPPTTLICWWAVNNGVCELAYNILINGTSNATTYTITLPIACSANRGSVIVGTGTDNGVATMIAATVNSGASSVSVSKAPGAVVFTASGAKGGAFSLRYPI